MLDLRYLTLQKPGRAGVKYLFSLTNMQYEYSSGHLADPVLRRGS